ncbi:MAG TPA: TIGR04282 family arsenosugar biosynthesis glycosyltransferase [Methyloceanibacter sp.]|jgi:rSAM/selenodomain-associated transferase 1|nr:TIGR04282 family arsenosugar biosynthesis glycosyltransferase [Methyloceanibacter sp.]
MARRSGGRKRGASFAKRLVIMAKSPDMGRVKRRLAGEIGESAAIRFYRGCLSHTLLRLARDPRWLTVLAVDQGRGRARRFSPLRKRLTFLPQGDGDLGRRMQRLFTRLPPGPVVIVGTDIPSVRPGHIAEAFRLLGGADAVFGPAPDGGYWLVGLRRTPRVPAPFAAVRWSGPHALADTLANLKGKRVAMAARLSDVDTAEDLRRESARSGRLISTITTL